MNDLLFFLVLGACPGEITFTGAPAAGAGLALVAGGGVCGGSG